MSAPDRESWRRGPIPRGGDGDGEIDRELRFHLDAAVEAGLARGLSEEEARRRVLAEFEDLEWIRGEMRRQRRRGARRERREDVVETTWRDVRLGARRLARRPGFTLAALATLALGLGATVSVFGVVRGVLLEPLPYPEPERLLRIWPAQNFNIALADRFRDAASLEALAGVSMWSFTLTGMGRAEKVSGAAVDPELFRVLGVRPALGRTFLPEERYRDRADVVVLSHDLWLRRFGGDPDVVGRRIDVVGQGIETREVVGVMASSFRPLQPDTELLVPLATSPGRTVASDSSWYVNTVVARLAPGAGIDQADQEVRELARRLREEYPGILGEEVVAQAGVAGLLDSTVEDVRPGLWILLGAVALVLAVACANVANLLLAEGSRRGRDVAVRAALGASRKHLIRQSLTESALLALAGGGLGVLLAWWGLTAASGGLHLALPRAGEVGLDPAVLAFAFGVSAGTVLLFGLLPAFRVTGDPGDRLRGGGRTGTGERGQGASRWLVAVETGMAVLLVVGAGLLLRSFWALSTTDPGFDAEGVLVVEVAAPGAEDPERRAELQQFYGGLLERVRGLPGVVSAGAIHLLPMTANNWSFPYLAEGMTPSGDEPLPVANFRIVSEGYFRTLGIPLVRGRDLGPADDESGPRALVVNETLARRLWPDQDPLGKELRIFGNMSHRVVGVVGDVRQHGLDREPFPEMYVSHRQWSAGSFYFMVRSDADPAALAGPVREAVWSLDPGVPVPLATPLTDVVGDSVARARFFTLLLTGFGALALVLGAVGVYGVMAHTMGRRLREFGIRLALGAGPRAVVREAVAGGLGPVVAGLAGGLLAAAGASRLLEGLLYQVSPRDVPTYLVVAMVLGSVALAAIWIPARRASRVDPVKVLGAE